MLQELGIKGNGPKTLNQDNLGAISWTSQVQILRNVKHVGIRYAFVNESIENGNIQVLYTPSEENLADSITKTLVGASFAKHRETFHVIPALSRGGVLE